MISGRSRAVRALRLAVGRLTDRPAVAVWPWLEENPYQRLLHASDATRVLVEPRLSAVEKLARAGLVQVLHLHWEEDVFWRDASAADPAALAEGFVAQVARIKAAGVPLVWTCHNYPPVAFEVAPYREPFARMRRFLAARADMIHVHSDHARDYLAAEWGADPARIEVIAHPSYEGLYPPVAPREGLPEQRRFELFGTVTPYKNTPMVMEAFGRLARPDRVARLSVHGAGTPEALGPAPAGVSLSTDLRAAPEAEIPAIFADADFAVIGAKRLLTSGSAMLPLSFGVPVIAPDLPGLRQNLPEALAPLGYAPGDASALAAAVDRACAMPAADYAALSRACIEHARALRPAAQSERLVEAMRRRGFLDRRRTRSLQS